jgi:hypothetical protein
MLPGRRQRRCGRTEHPAGRLRACGLQSFVIVDERVRVHAKERTDRSVVSEWAHRSIAGVIRRFSLFDIYFYPVSGSQRAFLCVFPANSLK